MIEISSRMDEMLGYYSSGYSFTGFSLGETAGKSLQAFGYVYIIMKEQKVRQGLSKAFVCLLMHCSKISESEV